MHWADGAIDTSMMPPLRLNTTTISARPPANWPGDNANAERGTEQFCAHAQLPLEVAHLFLQPLPLGPQLFLERRGSHRPLIGDDRAVELASRHAVPT
jgi:hypothetical protein